MIREVVNETSITILIEKLEKCVHEEIISYLTLYQEKIFTLEMTEGSLLKMHIDEFNQVCDTLATIDEALADKGKTLLLVCSLLESYKKFVDTLMYGRQTLSFDEVKSALNTREL